MVTTSILPLSLALAFSAATNNNVEAKPYTLHANYDQPVLIECTKVVLEFRVGGADRNTQSRDCGKKPNT